MTNIFISYSRVDSEFATRLHDSLVELGASVFLDVAGILGGDNWSSVIQRGLDAAEVMLLVVSPNSMSSPNVADEWQYFSDQQKLIVPIVWRPAKLHFQLNRLQRINFDKRDYHTALVELVTTLNKRGFALAVPKSPAPEPVPIAPPPIQPAANPRPTKPMPRGVIVGILTLFLVGVVVVAILLSSREDDPKQGSRPNPSATATARIGPTTENQPPDEPTHQPTATSSATATREATPLLMTPTAVAVNDAEDGFPSVERVSIEEGWCGPFSPDSTLLATSGGVFVTDSGELRLTLNAEHAAFNPDSSLIAIPNDAVYRTSDGVTLFRFEGGDPLFSPDGQYLATWAGVYATASGELLFPFFGDRNTPMLFSADSQWVLVASDGLYQINPPDGEHRRVEYEYENLSPDAKWLMGSSGLIEVASGEVVLDSVTKGIFSPDSRWLAIGNYGPLIDLTTLKEVGDITLYDPVFSSDSQWLFSAAGVYSLLRVRQRFVPDGVGGVFNADNTLLATSDGGLYDLATGQRRFKLLTFLGDFSADGQWLYNLVDGLTVYDVATGENKVVLEGTDLTQLSPNRQYLISSVGGCALYRITP